MQKGDLMTYSSNIVMQDTKVTAQMGVQMLFDVVGSASVDDVRRKNKR